MKDKIELSARMLQVAEFVPVCDTVADVGCDHGYVSIYLLQNRVAKHVLAMDVRSGPLSRAEQNRNHAGLQSCMECRLSDGLERLMPGEADAIVIAGMGGPLMVDILEKGRQRDVCCDTLVLQPQSDIPAVRRYLHSIDYTICREAFLKDDGKYYTVIQAERRAGVVQVETYAQVEYVYGKMLLDAQNAVLYEYLQREHNQLEMIRENLNQQMEHGETEKIRLRVQELDEQLTLNEKARAYFV